MKKYVLVLLIFLPLVEFSCTKEKDYKSEITDFLVKWAISLRDRNYSDYSKMVKYVKSEQQFMQKYESYYLEQPVILDLEKRNEDGENIVFRANVSFNGIDRVKKMKNADINSILLIEKKGDSYKIDEQIFINNRYD